MLVNPRGKPGRGWGSVLAAFVPGWIPERRDAVVGPVVASFDEG